MSEVQLERLMPKRGSFRIAQPNFTESGELHRIMIYYPLELAETFLINQKILDPWAKRKAGTTFAEQDPDSLKLYMNYLIYDQPEFSQPLVLSRFFLSKKVRGDARQKAEETERSIRKDLAALFQPNLLMVEKPVEKASITSVEKQSLSSLVASIDTYLKQASNDDKILELINKIENDDLKSELLLEIITFLKTKDFKVKPEILNNLRGLIR